mmetsp:Transcript_56793/g.90468  ORF Transcript_56793/g.90468 Transcript_56793/m.90468 type:complete len:80 (+) Transcript_56793:66-305(+)|eukprot:CAMPEP_0197021194 /NCGR_PEP_ID=MMETSP1384-20130603/2099_1 /TAXON_ID=29189 /ORGANISM="Ammonia sp." /LENGTH=79 /DNA_ID=CAMNT_0042448965 /DNA_START=58 /DNA_END=297 /DNA_ORIENTATION=+
MDGNKDKHSKNSKKVIVQNYVAYALKCTKFGNNPLMAPAMCMQYLMEKRRSRKSKRDQENQRLIDNKEPEQENMTGLLI